MVLLSCVSIYCSAIDFKAVSQGALKGSTDDQAQLGAFYFQQREYEQAAIWLEKAADKGNVASKLNFGLLLLSGAGTKKDVKRACELFLEASKQSEIAAQLQLGLCYARGQLGEKNQEQAIFWLEKAARLKNYEARLRLAILYSKQKEELPRAHAWASLAASQESFPARAYSLKQSLEKRLSEKDLQKSARLRSGDFRNLNFGMQIEEVLARIKSPVYSHKKNGKGGKVDQELLIFRDGLFDTPLEMELEFLDQGLRKVTFRGGYQDTASVYSKLKTSLQQALSDKGSEGENSPSADESWKFSERALTASLDYQLMRIKKDSLIGDVTQVELLITESVAESKSVSQ